MDANRERQLLLRIHEHGDQHARKQLAEETLPLAYALAARYVNRGEPLEDLVQVACIGIMKAIDGFDIRQEVRFSSYATPTVLGEIRRHFRDKTWAIRVPRPLQDRQLRVAKVRDALTAKLGHAPSVPEIAAAIDAPVEDVVAAVLSTNARRGRSLDEPIGCATRTTSPRPRSASAWGSARCRYRASLAGLSRSCGGGSSVRWS